MNNSIYYNASDEDGMNSSLFQEVSSLPALFSTVLVEDVLAGGEVHNHSFESREPLLTG